MTAAGAHHQTSSTDDLAVDMLERVHQRLEQMGPEGRSLLRTAARDGLLGPGKRVRPMLAMLAAEHVGGRAEDALDFGCAVEMAHAASLVLDDLPCMDDATLRRGRPALHRAHGEDAAILAAVALLNQSTRTLLQLQTTAETKIRLIDLLTGAIGFEGLTEGQMLDLRAPAVQRDAGGLRRINDLKTGVLFVAAVRGGGLLGGADARQMEALGVYGEAVGFAFQLCDDLMDVTATSSATGKDAGQDADQITFVDLWGEGRARAALRQTLVRACEAVGPESALSTYIRNVFARAPVGV